MSILTKPFANSSAGLLLLRLLLGVVFFAHGAQKVLGWFGGYGLPATVNFFEQTWAIPPFLTYIAAFTEFLGGIALVVGILTRIFALGLVIEMTVAIFLAHPPAKGLFNPGGFEFPLSLLVMALTIFLLGSGKYSIDEKVFRQSPLNGT